MNFVDSKKILIVVNSVDVFLNFRLNVATAAKAIGHDVTVCCPKSKRSEEVINKGFKFVPIKLDPSSFSIYREFIALIDLFLLYRALKPDVAHHFTIKPVIFGSLAARIAKVPLIVNEMTGLGYVHLSKGLGGIVRRALVRFLYKLAFLRKNQVVVFYNTEDFYEFTNRKLLGNSTSVLIKGVGVDPDLFFDSAEPDGVPTVALIARLLRNKGVFEYIAAIKILKARGVSGRFQILGTFAGSNPDAISQEQINNWISEGIAEFVGRVEDIGAFVRGVNIVCLPSYREGLSRVLLEAAASGRACVASDVPGCRDIIEHGVNGLLVPPYDSNSLADSLQKLLEDSELRKRMGRAGRRKIEEEGFADDAVTSPIMKIYKCLVENTLALDRSIVLSKM